MKTYIVRVHYAIRAKDAEVARERLIAALAEFDVDMQDLEYACVDNVDEIAEAQPSDC